MSNDSITKTLLVALLLCLVCSAMVTGIAITLREKQDFNKAQEQKKNILKAAGFQVNNSNIEQLFQQIETKIINLNTGIITQDFRPSQFNQRQAAKNLKLSTALNSLQDIAGIKRRENYSYVYFIKGKSQKDDGVILPIYGKGLWSTMYGFIALENDYNTIKGFSFYEHAETPGLGGEVDNPAWKKKWIGKKIQDSQNQLRIEVIKGQVQKQNPDALYQVDGLSGATITTRGISNLVRFWLGNNGFRPFLHNLIFHKK